MIKKETIVVTLDLTIAGTIDTSACFTITGIGIVENNWNNQLAIFPNPTMGEFTINVGEIQEEIAVKINDISGRVIAIRQYPAVPLIQINLDAPAGVYFVTLQTKEKSAVIKLIKK